MTPTDTFNTLRRDPFLSVLQEISNRSGYPDNLNASKLVWSSGNDNLSPYWEEFFSKRGWTIKDFEKECKK